MLRQQIRNSTKVLEIKPLIVFQIFGFTCNFNIKFSIIKATASQKFANK